MNRLAPRVQVVWIIRSALIATLIGGGLLIAHVLLQAPLWLSPVGAGLILLIGVPIARLRYRKWGYEIRDDALYLERGVFTEVRTVIPYVRIQHVDSRRNPLERAVGLASTVVYTAGSRGSDVRIPGLTDEEAKGLRERVKQLSILSEGGDAV